MFEKFKNRLEINGTLTTVTPLRVSEGRSTEPIGSDLPVMKDALKFPFIPGSSFKGALRSRLESFLRGILGDNPHLVANPANEDEWSITTSQMKDIKEYIQQQYTDDHYDRALTSEILQQTDLISYLFGSPWLASKFQVRDLTVVPDYWFGQFEERDGVVIDRDTETAAEGKLYDFQIVPAGIPFSFQAVVENAEEWELGLLMIGLHQFETEQIPLGGARSRGLGIVRLEIEKMNWFDYDNPHDLLEYLKKLMHNDKTAYENAEDFKDRWVNQLMEHLKQKLNNNATQEAN